MRPAASRAARSTSAIGLRDVVSPASSVIPAADTNAMSKLSPGMNSTVQRPVIVRVCWSSSPGQTTTWIESARMLAGDHRRVRDQRELERRRGQRAWRERERGRRRVEEDRRAVRDERRRVRGDRRLGLAACADPVLPGRRVRGARPPARRAPPRTRSTSPSRASCSRSRCAVMFEMACARASSATSRRRHAGSARGSGRGASMRAHPSFLTKPHMCARRVLIDSSTSHE